jgi:hypothetical protein
MKAFFGYILMAVGALIAVLCGLCTVVWLVAGFRDLFRDESLGLLTLIVGVLPTSIGVGLFLWGRSLARVPESPARWMPPANFTGGDEEERP